jgi:hypothetical protein
MLKMLIKLLFVKYHFNLWRVREYDFDEVHFSLNP